VSLDFDFSILINNCVALCRKLASVSWV